MMEHKRGQPWARLNYTGGKKRWHATEGAIAICGRQRFDHPRAEYVEAQPERGKLCKSCLAKLAYEIPEEFKTQVNP